jgi:hypothetical protein
MTLGLVGWDEGFAWLYFIYLFDTPKNEKKLFV